MLVRQPQVEDAPAVAAVHARSWRAAYRGLMPEAALAKLSEVALAEMWRRRFERRQPTVFVADGRDGVVGWVSLEVSGGLGEVLGLYVDPDVWSVGIGRTLMTRALDTLKEAEAERVGLWVLAENYPARRFYEAVGFERVDGAGRTVERYGASLPEVRYERQIS